MICDPVIPDRDLAEAVAVVRLVFAEFVDGRVAEEVVREYFEVRWPPWTDAELILAMKALVLH